MRATATTATTAATAAARLAKRTTAGIAAAAAASIALATCGHSTVPFPWPAKEKPTASVHAAVTTVNARYDRRTSPVLVRKVARATRANLDYAAYHANFMNADSEPQGAAAASAGRRPDTSNAFDGALEAATLTGALQTVPLSPAERASPFAAAPLIELLASKQVPGADVLEDVAGRVRAEDWGLGGGPQLVRQTVAALYLHDAGPAKAPEIWVKVEFAPWFKSFAGVPDADGDGHGELYGRVPPAALGAKAADLAIFIREEYAGRVLSMAEVKRWAHQLASYWYPSYNTDLADVGAAWPDAQTEAPVLSHLGQQRFAAPTVVMRGKPQGQPVYNVFVVAELDGAPGSPSAASSSPPGAAGSAAAAKPAAPVRLPRTVPSPDPAPIVAAVNSELAAHGGSWSKWAGEVSPLHKLMGAKLTAIPAGAKALAGSDGFLFFGQSLAYVTAGDLGRQRRGRNPIPAIVHFRNLLAQRGVDLLFVPVPTKEEIFPDKLALSEGERRTTAPFVGQVVNPFERKFILDLSAKGVEVLDLLPAFLQARGQAHGTPAPLFQAQDTHWNHRGLELAARELAGRLRAYPWYKELAAHRRAYRTKAVPFSRYGDLHSRLPEADKARYRPEELVGHQVMAADGTLYEDDPDSPVVLLGDSFTAVYQLMDCEHAGVSAHLAKELGYPIDLVMSYGGGPNVRQKLLRRGLGALETKKVVIWMMTARDLHDFWEGWQPVTSK